MSREREPLPEREEFIPLPLPAPIILPNVDITQASTQVMSLGSASSASSILTWRTDYTFLTLGSGTGTIATNSTFPLQFTKNSEGFVHCKGSVQLDVTAGNITGRFVQFPAGYRPGGSSTGVSGNKWQGILGDGGTGSPVYLRPDGIMFFNTAFFSGTYYLNFGDLSWFAEN